MGRNYTSGLVSRLLCLFFLFSEWILNCWCEENTGRHFKGFYLSKILILSKILSMQNNKHKGDRIVNTDRHKNIRTRVATNTDSTNDWAKIRSLQSYSQVQCYITEPFKQLRPFTLDHATNTTTRNSRTRFSLRESPKLINIQTDNKTTDQINNYSIYSYFSPKYAFNILSNTQITT